jgi:hypothetical protein
LKPTKTTNPLHFEDLDPGRFEDLCLEIVNRYKAWYLINHYGGVGDEGVDIYAVEKDGSISKKWVFQCKRYTEIDRTKLQGIVDKLVKNNSIPDILVLIISCNLSKGKSEFFESYAKQSNIKEIFIWTKSILETKLYSDYPDLLAKYFEISNKTQNITKNKEIAKIIKKKEKFRKDFLQKFYLKLYVSGRKAFKFSEIIICKNTHTPYEDQENKQDEFGWFNYFRVEPQIIRDEGVEVFFGGETIIFDEEGYWDFYNQKESYDEKRFKKANFFKVGIIPFENIDFWDLHSTIGKPVVYCKYNEKSGPFKKIFYRLGDNEFFILDENLRLSK